ncbi:MAG: hypothetical protein LBT33_01490 [Spirochaetia bacterium]|jgi:hypothetical protein|nr:hypothetical protein [Spirochaetia bacterium]
MTIEQTVEIPESRRITLDLPPQVPTGKARIAVNIIGFPHAASSWTAEYISSLCAPKPQTGVSPHEALERLWGCCADTGDTMEAYFERHHAENNRERAMEKTER